MLAHGPAAISRCVLGTALIIGAVSVAGAADDVFRPTPPPASQTSRLSAPPATTTRAAHVANRVITLAPHITELVFAAGAGDKIVATVSSSNYPPQALQIPRVGDGLTVDAEQLLTLQPDLVVGWQNSLAMQKLTPTLTGLNISVVYSEPRHLNDIPADIERLGSLLGTQEYANIKASGLREQLSSLRQRYAGRKPVSVFIEVGTGPLYTLGDDTLTNDAIRSCGGVNVFRQSALVAPAVTVESVLSSKPEVVIVANGAADHVALRADYWHGLHLPAAQQHHVYGMNPDALLRPGPRLIGVMQELCDDINRARRQQDGTTAQD